MGIFDKLKQAKNFMTGGGAIINVRTDGQVHNGNEPVPVIIDCEVKDTDIEVRNVYLRVKAIEEVVAKDVDLVREEDGQIHSYREDVSNHTITYESEIQVEGSLTLEAKERYQWTVDLQIPSDIPGTYRGRNAVHEWQVYAGLDVAGNDPDSGWVTIEVRK